MRRRGFLPLALAATLGGCGGNGFLARLFGRKRVPAAPPIRYVVGEPYAISGVWQYPRERFALIETGLATVAGAHAPLTADNERYDATALAAGHRTLQLPAIARVTNLDNGRQIAVRVNDRGPLALGRLVELTPRAAQLLQTGDGTRVRFEVMESESRQLAAALQGDAGRLPIATAPAGAVRAEQLAPPSGARSETGRIAASLPGVAAVAEVSAPPPVPERLPEVITQTYASPGLLYLDSSDFSRLQYARVLAARLGFLNADIVTDQSGANDRPFRVRAGPFADVRSADAALDRALAAGVTDVRIVVGN